VPGVGPAQKLGLAMNPFVSIPTLADYLVEGYWASKGKPPRYWDGHTVSVNITYLTAAEQDLAISALNAWYEICDISFTFTSGPAQIFYTHTGSGNPGTTWDWNYALQWAAFINIPSGSNGGVTNISMYETYLHETGHALGLGHLGPYNESKDYHPTYSADAIFANDTYQWSLMSYFDQSNYGGATDTYVVTPQMADIYAMQSIYGGALARTGNTTYGFHSNAGWMYDFNNYFGIYADMPAFTIYDNGGIDTLDCSDFWADQIIDLNPGHWSSVGGEVNNIGIYVSSKIENAVGGHGNDVIIPNGILKGTLTGGGGNDIFQGRIMGIAGYNITDMNVGDRLNFTDAALGTFSHIQLGTTLSYNYYGNTHELTLSNNPIGHFIEISDFFFGGVDLKLAAADPHLHDFNGDDRSDFLLRNDNGAVGLWEMNGATPILQASLGVFIPAWHIGATGDFNGDHASDILWRHDSGLLGLWEMNGATPILQASLGVLSNDWHFLETGDFNGDGKNDILWRHDGGFVVMWEMNGATTILTAAMGVVGNEWHVVKTGDFNGDGKSDILWRHDNGALDLWEMDGPKPILKVGLGTVGNDFHIEGLSDFNGDGKSDILWRHDNGFTSLCFMDGPSTIGKPNLGVIIPAWHVEDIADFNDDGKADILWRHDTGLTGLWEMNGATPILQASLGVFSNDWHFVA
jgi:serralysin